MTFEFGQNWKRFAAGHLTRERIEIAKRCLLELLELSDLKGKSFLDIGSGSGLSSLAAFELGARCVTSFDLDPLSVETTEMLRQRVGNPGHWSVMRGSILDESFLASLKKADIVYSWGVLHHTGKMWKAIENAASLVDFDGILFIAIYTTTDRSPYWIKTKQVYNKASPFRKRVMETRHILGLLGRRLVRGNSPLSFIREYHKSRGMAFMTDVRDWLGGWPYEDAKIEEVLHFCRTRINLELVNIRTGEANTEYVFRRRSTRG
jgi:SAM-dependent methyltransferase